MIVWLISCLILQATRASHDTLDFFSCWEGVSTDASLRVRLNSCFPTDASISPLVYQKWFIPSSDNYLLNVYGFMSKDECVSWHEGITSDEWPDITIQRFDVGVHVNKDDCSRNASIPYAYIAATTHSGSYTSQRRLRSTKTFIAKGYEESSSSCKLVDSMGEFTVPIGSCFYDPSDMFVNFGWTDGQYLYSITADGGTSYSVSFSKLNMLANNRVMKYCKSTHSLSELERTLSRVVPT